MQFLLVAKGFKVVALSLLLLADYVFLGIESEFALLAVGGSFSGAVVLAYSEKWRGIIDLVVRILIATICGLFCGAFVARYLNLTNKADLGLCFFLAGALSLAAVVALIHFWRGNVKGLIVAVLKTRFNIEVKETKKKET